MFTIIGLLTFMIITIYNFYMVDNEINKNCLYTPMKKYFLFVCNQCTEIHNALVV